MRTAEWKVGWKITVLIIKFVGFATDTALECHATSPTCKDCADGYSHRPCWAQGIE